MIADNFDKKSKDEDGTKKKSRAAGPLEIVSTCCESTCCEN